MFWKVKWTKIHSSLVHIFLSGLIKELDIHKTEYATNYLASHATYILVQKDVTPEVDSSDSRSTTPTVQQYTYKPLLERSTDLFPNFRLHVAEVEKIRPKRTGSKSPSPAGRLLSKPKKILNKPAMKKTKWSTFLTTYPLHPWGHRPFLFPVYRLNFFTVYNTRWQPLRCTIYRLSEKSWTIFWSNVNCIDEYPCLLSHIIKNGLLPTSEH